MALKKIQKTQSLRDKAYESLRTALFQGVFTPGQKVTEKEIAESLGVSRTPVREALNLFRQQGLLKQSHGGSYIVTSPSLQQIEDVFEIRRILEPLAASKVFSHCSETDVDKLESIIAGEEELMDEQDSSKTFILNLEFRTTFFRLCGNERLSNIIEAFMDHIHFLGMLTLRDRTTREIVINGQKNIVSALRARNETALMEAVNKHLDVAYEIIMAELR